MPAAWFLRTWFNFLINNFKSLAVLLLHFFKYSEHVFFGRDGGATTLSRMTFSIMTLSITTLSIMTLSIMTLSIMTLRIMTFSITTLTITTVSLMTLSIIINQTRHSAQ